MKRTIEQAVFLIYLADDGDGWECSWNIGVDDDAPRGVEHGSTPVSAAIAGEIAVRKALKR